LADNVIVYSNSASFLDVAAPATCATSAAPGNTTTDCFGGTSSATPFTSGAAALAVQAAGKGVLTPADMRDVLTVSGDLVTDPKNGRVTPRVNGLGVVTEAAAYGGGEPPPPPPNTAPSAEFSSNCTDLSCDFTDASSDSDGNIVSRSWDFGDGNGATAQNPSHSYAAAGTYTVTLTVTDDDGATDSASQPVTVTAPAANQPPTADFGLSCTDLDCSFTDASSDNDGSIVSRRWDFGDGGSSTATNPSHSYAAGGTYTVSLTVTDDDGASDTASQSVTVSAPDPGGINLVASSTSEGRTWTAIVTDTNGGALAGIFSNGSGSCSGDTCTRSGIRKNIGSVVFTEDTTRQTITVSKP
jgi:PKD repeat protein